MPPHTLSSLKAVLMATFATLGAAFHSLPSGIQSAAIATSLLTVVDTLTGVWVAGRRRSVVSFTMRQKLAAKSLQFLEILALGFAGRLISDSWVPIGSAVGVIIGIELHSILENLTRLERLGGAPLGPLRTGVQKLATFFPAEEITGPGAGSDAGKGPAEK